MAAASMQRRWEGLKPLLVGAILFAALGLVVWWFWPRDGIEIQRQRVIQQITVVQPPPPPPPPPKPEEKIMKEEEVVQPNDKPDEQKPVEKPVETPSQAPPSPASAQPAGLDRPADAGSDSFHLAAGGGGGLFGRGGGGGGGGNGWGRFVEGHVQRALMRDPRTRAARGFVRVSFDIDAAGRFTSAALQSSTGDDRLDAAIRDVLAKLPPLGRPRPSGQAGQTNATISMKRTGA